MMCLTATVYGQSSSGLFIPFFLQLYRILVLGWFYPEASSWGCTIFFLLVLSIFYPISGACGMITLMSITGVCWPGTMNILATIVAFLQGTVCGLFIILGYQ
jgi:hypothetical protein